MFVALEALDVQAALARLLTETSALFQQTRLFRRNAAGPLVEALCDLFGRQCTDLERGEAAIIARIVALGCEPPLMAPETLWLSEIRDSATMIMTLTDGHARAGAAAADLVRAACEAGDLSTADLARFRVEVHQRTAAMYRVVQRFQPTGQ